MTISWILNTRIRLFTIILLATLQITSCSTTEESANSNVTPISAISSAADIATTDVAMYSYNANLSNALPLSGAVLAQTTVYIFFNNPDKYSSMNFYCCKGISGASSGEAHSAPVRDSSAPFVYSADLSQYSTTGTRELYVDATRIDGSGLDSLSINFSIDIGTTSVPAVSNVKLSWIAPSQREDNNPISPAEIAGYKIYYGTTAGNYTESVQINDNSVYDYTLAGLAKGTYYIVMTTRDSDGRESQYSAVVTKTI